MREYLYRKIDAFTSGTSLGNPAACFYLENAHDLSVAEMLEIAKRHKGFVSEVVYCVPWDENSFQLTYYSSECEVDFCGHGTVACMHNLIQETPRLLDQKEIAIRTNKKGTLTVYNEMTDNDSVYIAAPAPRHLGTHLEATAIAQGLQIAPDHISRSCPIDVIDVGLRTLIVPLATLDNTIRLFPDEQNLKTFCLKNDIDIVLIYVFETQNPKHSAHTRVFAPRFGYLEDPATGSGNSAFGYYLLKNNLWDGVRSLSIEQGGIDRVFNVVNLALKDDRVLFGGSATMRIKGVYCL